jgi:hypothetical protein
MIALKLHAICFSTPPRTARTIANVVLSAGIPVFVQSVLCRQEIVQTHRNGLTGLVRAEDWILGCLDERLRQMRVVSIGPPPSARHDVMRMAPLG